MKKLQNKIAFFQIMPSLLFIFLFFIFLLRGNIAGQSSTDQKIFSPVTAEKLPDFMDSYGVVFRDLNSDELPDLYVVRFRNLNRLFLNQGKNKSFSDFTIESQLGGNLNPRGKQNLELGTSSADFDNDGRPDIAIGGWGVTTRIFRQKRQQHFEDITNQLKMDLPLDGNGVFWADVNADGNLDMLITDERHPNRLFLGNGSGRFVDKSTDWGLTHHGASQGAAFADVDSDGYPDLYICNWFGPDIFYRNTGTGSFEQVLLNLAHLTQTFNSNGVSFGDIDNDADLDMIVTDRNGRSSLYRNDTAPKTRQWHFTDITAVADIRIPLPAYGTVVADFNNDGWQDIWVNCIGPNMIFLNQGAGQQTLRFSRYFISPNSSENYSTGAAAADMDLDGDLDLFVANKDTHSVLYRNNTDNRNFIQIKLVGVKSNRDAIGSKIWLFEKDDNEDLTLAGFRYLQGGGGYLSQNSPVFSFGVKYSKSYQARIQFPDGRELMLQDVVPGSRQVVYEYTGLVKVFYRSSHFLRRMSDQPGFWIDLALFFLLLFILIGYIVFSNNRYLWTTRQTIFFLSLTVIILYGIFLALQSYPFRIRLVAQIISVSSFFILLSYFLEKIRRLELARTEYRRLLQDFSQDLISIKENKELYQKLVETIFQAIQPAFCAYYEFTGKEFIKSAWQGPFSGTEKFSLSGEVVASLKSGDLIISSKILKQPEVPQGQIFPIKRSDRILGLLILGTAGQTVQFATKDQAVFRTLATQTAVAIENNRYIEETKQLIQKVTEAETREKYVLELENKNKELQRLYQNLQDTQAQLIQSEKMVSLGQLVAGIAHELNNPISFVYANMIALEKYIGAIDKLLTLLTDKFDHNSSGEEISAAFAKIRQDLELDFIRSDMNNLISDSLEGSRRVKEVVLNLKNFSRLDEAEIKKVNLHEGLDSTLLLIDNEIKNRITVHKDYGDLPKVRCRPGQINQVFMNLLINAAQAIPGKGNIWIHTAANKNRVEISIKDDGRGIPKSLQNKIFDPFFTTKPVGEGTGLGLSISYKIINDHGGSIRMESKENSGTKFIIDLPISGEPQKN